MNKIFLITGGNIGNRKKNLEAAATLIRDQIGIIVKSSKIYETDAWGITDQPAFYNQVHIVESNFSAKEILNKILNIEEKMGRVRTVKNAARIIDIDILFFNNEIINNPFTKNLEVYRLLNRPVCMMLVISLSVMVLFISQCLTDFMPDYRIAPIARKFL